MNFPDNLKYSTDHEWVKVEGNEALIGITDFAQSELGEIVYVDVTCIGDTFKKNEVFGSIEAVKTVSDLIIPIGGEVIEINCQLEDEPELVNKEPYGNGWIINVLIADMKEVDGLMSAEEYKAFIGK